MSKTQLRNKLFQNLFIVLGLLGFVLLLFARSTVFASDTGYHLKIGEWIIQNKAFPKYDTFSLLSSNMDFKFIAHEWLFDIFVYIINSIFSLNGIVIVSALFVFGSYIYSIFRSGAKLPALIVSVLFIYFRFTKGIYCKPDIYAAIFLVILGYIYLNEKILWKKYLSVCLLTVFLVNFHGSYFTIVLLQFVWLFICKSILNKRVDKHDLFLIISAFMCSLLNPYGFNIYKYLFVVFGDTGYLSSDYLPFTFSTISQLLVVLIVCTLSIIGYVKHENKNVLDLAIMFMYLAMLLYYGRTLNIFNYGFIIYMSKYLVWVFDFKYVKKISTILVGVCSVFLACLVLSHENLPNKSVQDYIVEDVLGENIVNEISNKRYYNDLGIGGYLIYLDSKPFIDTRSDVFTDVFGNPDIYSIAVKAQYDDAMMYNLASKYGLSHVLLEKNNITSQIFYASSLWEVSTESNNYVIFKKKG
jgi:hypothetical protein